MRGCLFLLCISLCLLASACARQSHLPADMAGAGAAWSRYQSQISHYRPPASARHQLSLRFGTQGDTRRVTALMWANTGDRLRLDISAGVGAGLANILEDGDSFLLYAQQQGTAYFSTGDRYPLLQIGLPIPLRLSSVFHLLNGDFAPLFGTAYARAEPEKGGLVFTLSSGDLAGSLTLDPAGRPLLWREDGDRGWQMRLGYSSDQSSAPYRLDLTHPSGQRAILLVKNREQLTTRFTPGQLRLTLPAGVETRPLQEYLNHS